MWSRHTGHSSRDRTLAFFTLPSSRPSASRNPSIVNDVWLHLLQEREKLVEQMYRCFSYDLSNAKHFSNTNQEKRTWSG